MAIKKETGARGFIQSKATPEKTQSLMGRPKKEGNHSRRTVYLPDDIWRELKVYGAYNDKSVSELLVMASREFLQKYSPK